MPSSTPAISSSVSGAGLAGGPAARHWPSAWIGMCLWGVGERASRRDPVQAAHQRHPPVHLVPGEDAAGDQVPGLGRDPLVVVADAWPGRARRSGSPVTCMTGEAVAQVSQALSGWRRRCRRTRPSYPSARVQFRWRWPIDSLNGEPQVFARVDDQVRNGPAWTLGAASFLPPAGRAWPPVRPGKSQAPVPLHGLPPRYSRPRPADGASVPHRLEATVRFDSRTQLTSGGNPDPLLQGPWSPPSQ